MADALDRDHSVALWSVFLDQENSEVRRMAEMLDDMETLRASKFHFKCDRNRWIVARAALRTLLGEVTQSSAQKIFISTTPEGKPYLEGSGTSVSFNISHSRDHALIALTNGNPVGVDIEYYDRGKELEPCIPEFCHAEECEQFSECRTPEERYNLLIRLWCAKEAYLKALGTGFAISPLELMVKWNADDSALISRNGVADGRFLIRFPTAVWMSNFCIAVSLPPDITCQPVKKIDAGLFISRGVV